jgi:UTP:GlnB (protein PII) uridylyltransferase
MVTELEARKVEEFIQEKLEELQERRRRYGGSVWLLEPHLKQGKGGLRDLQAALWIARVRHKVAGLGEAGERGLLPAREVKEARAARDLLWRLRNELHYATTGSPSTINAARPRHWGFAMRAASSASSSSCGRRTSRCRRSPGRPTR